jgi:hypothetical protein
LPTRTGLSAVNGLLRVPSKINATRLPLLWGLSVEELTPVQGLGDADAYGNLHAVHDHAICVLEKPGAQIPLSPADCYLRLRLTGREAA